MEKIRVEKQGRIFLPKRIRTKLGIRSGEELTIKETEGGIFLKVRCSPEKISSELKGCVKKGKIDPLNLKKMWGM